MASRGINLRLNCTGGQKPASETGEEIIARGTPRERIWKWGKCSQCGQRFGRGTFIPTHNRQQKGA